MEEEILIDTSESSSTNESADLSSIIEIQNNYKDMYYTFNLVNSVMNGVIIALLVVLIFGKGFQSNAR